ncbi:MAG: aminotransferase class V-fold PLP-dependent enzyme [Chloroflexi bacterium]|nr:aminotransferase class V-fold PLP-dependent enzyme [Chloroflexota bacterium]
MTTKRVPEAYARLGVKPVINAQSWVTALGGSLMRPEVLRAMDEAATAFVDMTDLNLAAGKVVARACGAEAGLVTAGASASETIAIAACMTGTDEAKVEQLPNTAGMKDQVLIFKGERNRYDMAFEVPGARLVEWGMLGGAKPYQLEAAITDKTVAIATVFGPFIRRGLPLPELCEIAHKHGVPVVVDAAAEVPPMENLTKFIKQGADLVLFSGGKGIGGPQNTGLLAGRKDLIDAGIVNSLNLHSPRAGIARGMKVSKESLVGLVTALELFLESDEQSMLAGWTKKSTYLQSRLKGIPGLRVVIEGPDPNRHGPQPVLYFESGYQGPKPAEIRKRLLEKDPPIHVGGGGVRDEINVVMVNVQDGEEVIIADRLLEIIKGAKPAR